MAGKAESVTSKPVMMNLLHSNINKNIMIELSHAGFCGFTFKQVVGNEREMKYAKFNRTYDTEKEFEEMRKKGLFQSC